MGVKKSVPIPPKKDALPATARPVATHPSPDQAPDQAQTLVAPPSSSKSTVSSGLLS